MPFQFSSGQKAGCNRGVGDVHALDDVAVSILIRPEGRMQPPEPGQAITVHRFQSSSGLLAGCNGDNEAHNRKHPHGFNPHPAFWPDATFPHRGLPGALQVSILIRPEGRMQRGSPAAGGPDCGRVSILIRPEGRMQLLGLGFDRQGDGSVSILIRPEGRMQPLQHPVPPAVACGFNPHPARRPDATSSPGRVSAVD